MQPESNYRLVHLIGAEADPRVEAMRILRGVLVQQMTATQRAHVHDVCKLRRRAPSESTTGVRRRPRRRAAGAPRAGGMRMVQRPGVEAR